MFIKQQLIAWTKITTIYILLVILVSVFFRSYPEYDIAVSDYFFQDGWNFKAVPFFIISRELGSIIPLLFYIFFLGYLIYLCCARRAWVFLSPKVALFGFITFSLSSIIVVNLIFKEHWGRARPKKVNLFYGDKEFSLPWTISDNCDNNCSFISGEASAAFWLLFMVIFLPKRYRKPTLYIGFVVASYISLLRISFGAHFLSDVLLGALITLVISSLLYIWLYVYNPPWSRDFKIESNLRGVGDWIKARFTS